MGELVLTRYLYHRDEVAHSLVTCLLVKSTFKEALFWVSEMYYSGFQLETWELLWKIYYDFFAIRNPKFERKIQRAHRKWSQTNKIERLVEVVNYLYHCSTPTFKVFHLRILEEKLPRSIYLGRTPKWLAALGLSKMERNFIRSIHKKSLPDISYYLSCISNHMDRCFEIVKLYYTKVKGYSLGIVDYKEISYVDKKHILYTLICYLMMETCEEVAQIRTVALVRKLEQESIDFFKETMAPVSPVWKTLAQRRLYPVHTLVGAFPIVRSDAGIEWNQILWYHWEYYARQCPLWKERFKEFGAVFADGKIVFANDDLLEEFYEKYGLEPDEQSRECQQKSLRSLETKTLGDWLDQIFPDRVGGGERQRLYYTF